MDAINHLIDNFQYKEMNISDIVGFDRKRKLYTYSDVCNLVTKGLASFEDFEVYRVGNDVFRVKRNE